MTTMNTVTDLLAELARSVPSLPRAACRGRRETFDSLEPDDVAQAVQICMACPERRPCARWAADQPPRSLLGVIGGTLYAYDFRYTTTKKEKIK